MNRTRPPSKPGPCIVAILGILLPLVVSFFHDTAFADEPRQCQVFVKQPNDTDWSNYTDIAAGGINSDAHRADVKINTEPSSQVVVTLQQGTGMYVPAQIEFNDGTILTAGQTTTIIADADGEIDGVLLSSDVLEGCTIQVQLADATPHERPDESNVDFEWNNYGGDDIWTSETDELIVGESSVQHYIMQHDDYRMDQHQMTFVVEQVQYLDGDGNLQTLDNTAENPHDLSGWAWFDDPDGYSDSDGVSSATLCVVDDDSIVSITMRVFDITVWKP